jgi:hypothetical protein
VPFQTVAQALAFINWTVLVSLAVGSWALVVVLARATDATRGYLAFTAGLAGVLGALAWLADTSLPSPSGLAIRAASPELDLARRVALGMLAAVGVVAAVRIRRGSRIALLGPLGLLAALAVLAIAAWGWSPEPATSIPLLVQLAVLSAVTGGSLAALILGHWYLVTPRISERPLTLATRLLSLAVGVQLLLFVAWALFGTGEAAGLQPLAILTSGAALLVWLRLLVSLLGPLALSWMAERTARTRSMESATGLLYIDFAAIVAGTIVAAALAYTQGVLA